MSKPVRVRFAPSPTGGLHLGGVRTALFNYLFAKKHGGTFVLRIEDTDQTRYVEGAEQYIIDTLEWCNITPDEGPHKVGNYGPYRQSERKELYKKYALELIEKGYAYYAFDTAEELEQMRVRFKSEQNPSPQYDKHTRMHMRNSLSLSQHEWSALLEQQVPYVIRLKMPENEMISFDDLIRGHITNQSELLDDKVLLKADGMPTYHLAVVVDDKLMDITHAFRGEEWLPSAPAHILLWKYLGWENDMPHWAHLPLILKPDGNGKLSKRDGDRLGFPVFASNWVAADGTLNTGFKENGFLPQAFVNFLALLGWNDGTEQELFTLPELEERFSIDRVHKGGAKFNYEKAKWYNHEWIKRIESNTNEFTFMFNYVKNELTQKGVQITDDLHLQDLMLLVKDRCTLLSDFYDQLIYFYERPQQIDRESIMNKWSDEKAVFFETFSNALTQLETWHAADIEQIFKTMAQEQNIKAGELQLPMRNMLVGAKFGPGVFAIAERIGKTETQARIEQGLSTIKS